MWRRRELDHRIDQQGPVRQAGQRDLYRREQKGRFGIRGLCEKIGPEGGEEPSKAQDEELAETILLPSVSHEVGEIKALGFPDEAEAVIESAEESIEKGEEDPAAVVISASAFTKTNELAHAYGLTVCGEE